MLDACYSVAPQSRRVALNPGTRLGAYEIVTAIGAGGMGEVYRAKDTRLGRTVAIKIVRSDASAGAAFQERLRREAKTISALDHPNICALYDVGHEAGLDYLVMQYVEGETLAAVLANGAMPPEAALACAGQIASALAAAHRRHIVHRDLKPANIMLTKSGVKLLDFGVAKLVSFPSAADLATHTSSPTAEGELIGTLNYMSPEQLEGKAIDTRSDLFSFGAVMFEMLCGRPAFAGDSTAATVAAIMRAEPPRLGDVHGFAARTPATVLRRVDRLLRRCFARPPDDRWQSAADLADELTWIEDEWRRPDGAPDGVHRPGARRWLPLAAACLAGTAIAAILVLMRPWQHAPAEPRLQFEISAPPQTTFAGVHDGIAVSPDGQNIVLSLAGESNRQRFLWLRPLASLQPRLLPGTENASSPSWSPNGGSVAFFADGKLKRIEIAGGSPLPLCDAVDSIYVPAGITWSREDVILFGGPEGLRRILASGGVAETVTRVDLARREIGHGFPQFLPDGDRFLYFIASDDVTVQGVYVGSLSDPQQRRQLLRTPSRAAYAPARSGHPAYLLWIRDRSLLAQRIDPELFQMVGDPVTVTDDLNVNIYNARPAFSISDQGVLTYFAGETFGKRRMVWMTRDGKEPSEAAPEAVYWNVGLAPGANRMAVGLWEIDGQTGQPNLDVWIWEFAQEARWRATTAPARDGAPVWSPTGAEIAYASARDSGVGQIFRRKASPGDRGEEPLTEGPRYKIPVDWSRDGKYIIYEEGQADLMALPLLDRKPIALANTPFVERAGSISPSGRWLAFVADYAGRLEVYVKPFDPGASDPHSQQPTPISRDGAVDVTWSPDGTELFFLDLSRRLMVVRLESGPHGISAEPPRPLFQADIRAARPDGQFATADGQRFLVILSPETGDDRQVMTVVTNWQYGLTR
jgi:serine/threonine protein kinase/Tol biopolymer transport system component